MKEGVPGQPEKETLYSQAEKLREQYVNTKDLVLAVGRFITDRGFAMPDRQYPKTILESRFTPADEAFEKGLLSCGAIASISAVMLRHVGLQVKLIHGEYSGSVDHAWISVLEPESGQWVDYDLTRKNPRELPTHVEKARVDSWEEIRERIESDHQTLKERTLARRKVEEGDKKGDI